MLFALFMPYTVCGRLNWVTRNQGMVSYIFRRVVPANLGDNICRDIFVLAGV